MGNTIIEQCKQNNRRIEYRNVRDYAKQVDQQRFISEFRFPVLVGSGVYSGNPVAPMDGEQTVLLNQRYIDQDDDAAISLHKAIFYLEPALTQHNSQVSIGRASSNDIVLDDDAISRTHATLILEDGQVSLADAGATNGTMLNGKLLEKGETKALSAGDTVGFGHYEFNFMSPERFYKWVVKY